MTLKARIIGTGSYLPERVLSNADLEQMVETSDEWIVTRTGMRERRIARADEFSSDMGAAAARRALKKAHVRVEDIHCILFVTLTPDYLCPSTACIVQRLLGATNACAIDIQSACTGYLQALSLARSLVEANTYRNVLVIAADKLSSVTNYRDRSTCVLFGDGAAASVITAEGPGLLLSDVHLGADGELAELLILPAGGCRNPPSLETVQAEQHYLQMSGSEVFKHAVRRMESACKECLAHAGLSEKDISWLIPHQANLRIIEAIAKRFEHLKGDRIFKTIHKYGNTSASSVAIALDELLQLQCVQSNERILLTAFGSGFTWGAALLTMGEGS